MSYLKYKLKFEKTFSVPLDLIERHLQESPKYLGNGLAIFDTPSTTQNMTVASGYTWNGCSPKYKFGPVVIGTPDFGNDTADASCLHDKLYELAGLHKFSRLLVDEIFLYMLREKGFKFSYTYYTAVRWFGWIAWNKYKKRNLKWKA